MTLTKCFMAQHHLSIIVQTSFSKIILKMNKLGRLIVHKKLRTYSCPINIKDWLSPNKKVL